MEKLTVTVNMLKAFVIIAMLSGCQNEEPVTQKSQTYITENDRIAKTIFTPQLLKEGSNDLEYYGDYDVNRGKLKKVTNTVENVYTEYNYNGQTIVAQRKNLFTHALIYQVTYYLDGSGKCVESLSTETNKPLKYEYGQLGRLMKVFNKNNINERIEFGYEQNSITLLKNATFYNQANAATIENNYSYMAQGGASTTENKYPTNPDALGTTSKYLPIFGAFHTYLPTYELVKNISTGQIISANYLTYTLNTTGYVKTITATSGMSNFVIVTNRTYTTPKL